MRQNDASSEQMEHRDAHEDDSHSIENVVSSCPAQSSCCPSHEDDTHLHPPSHHQPPTPQQQLQLQQRQTWCSATSLSTTLVSDGISYVRYESESQMPDIMKLITKDLSEPYSIYTYRYFIHNWPKLCFLAMDENTCVGAIVCKVLRNK